ncbi:LOB domain-containing protein 17-like [Diospyros lotus]|uniref:LOB domain-containing protein 17-like n=1 Tax=Diospyros lotus TaxID=55363 RepID=UPI002257120B|nr:LOB domain-containing protein 17-like [Diospyros lotus]
MSRIGFSCGACKYLRRRYIEGCIFAPYFYNEAGNIDFEVIHKVFGSKNPFNLLSHLPVKDRNEAVTTMIYEAQARIQDPTYGCVSEILILQQQDFVDSYANLQHVQNQIPPETNPILELDPSIAGDIDELGPVVFGRHQH